MLFSSIKGNYMPNLFWLCSFCGSKYQVNLLNEYKMAWLNAKSLLYSNLGRNCKRPIGIPRYRPYIRGNQRQFSGNICLEDDLRSRSFGTFVVKFLAWLPLLGLSNIKQLV